MAEERFIKSVGDEATGMTYLTLVEGEPGSVVRTEDRGRVRLDYNAEGVVVGVELDGLLGPIMTHGTLRELVNAWRGNPTITAFPEQPAHDWTGVFECAEDGCKRAAVDRDWFCAAHMEAGGDVA